MRTTVQSNGNGQAGGNGKGNEPTQEDLTVFEPAYTPEEGEEPVGWIETSSDGKETFLPKLPPEVVDERDEESQN